MNQSRCYKRKERKEHNVHDVQHSCECGTVVLPICRCVTCARTASTSMTRAHVDNSDSTIRLGRHAARRRPCPSILNTRCRNMDRHRRLIGWRHRPLRRRTQCACRCGHHRAHDVHENANDDEIRERTGMATRCYDGGWDESGAPLGQASAISRRIGVDRRRRIHRRAWWVGRQLAETHHDDSTGHILAVQRTDSGFRHHCCCCYCC